GEVQEVGRRARSVARMSWSRWKRAHSMKVCRRDAAEVGLGRLDTVGRNLDVRGPGNSVQEKAAIVVVREIVSEILAAEDEAASAVVAFVGPRDDLRTDAAFVLLRRCEQEVGAPRVRRQ